MATKIKAVKCPQCGSEKHTQIDDKRFRCNSCGTEFFIDDDDININVKHHFDFGNAGNGSNQSGHETVKELKIVALAVILPILAMILLIFIDRWTTPPSGNLTSKDSVKVHDQKICFFPMKSSGQMCFFYLVERNYSVGYNGDRSKYIDGYYYGFRDALSGKVLSEGLLISEKEADKLSISSFSSGEVRYFHQAHRWYMVVPKRFIYEIDPKTRSMKDVSNALFAKKPAMNTGVLLAKFINEDYGEGFLVNNNLAEAYYYFPATDRLYTEEAFNYARRLPPTELNGELRDSTYYKLQRVNISENTGAGGRLRLWQVRFKFHLGDPQDAGYFSYDMTHQWDRDQRLVSAIPITDWFTGFDAHLIYQDARYLLLAYRANLAEEAPTVFQLRNTKGAILWTQLLDRRAEVNYAVRDGSRIWFEAETDIRDMPDETYCYSLDLANGKWTRHNQFLTEYKIKGQ